MYRFCYHLNNLRFKQSQNINQSSAAHVVSYVFSNETYDKAVEMIVRPPYEGYSLIWRPWIVPSFMRGVTQCFNFELSQTNSVFSRAKAYLTSLLSISRAIGESCLLLGSNYSGWKELIFSSNYP